MNDKCQGFRASHRNRWQFLEEQILTDKQFLLYEYLIDIADWDEGHKKYGMFEFFPEEHRTVFHKSSETIGDWFGRLRQLGFVSVEDEKRSLYKVIKFERYIPFYAKQYANEEKELPIRKIIAGWELKGDYTRKRRLREGKIPVKQRLSLKSADAKVCVSFKNEFRVMDGYGFGERDLAEIFFGGDMDQFGLHWKVING